MGTDVHSAFQKRTESGWEDVESEYSGDRHYALFAWIGNVRNGFGFAGIPTHEKITPLSDGRGLPEDLEYDSDTVSGRDFGDHSYSWLSADEILTAKPPQIMRSGIIGVEEFRKWDGVSAPDGWCGGIHGPKVVLAETAAEVTVQTTHVRIEWLEDTRESFAYFIDEVRRLKDLHGEVRFVFGFDS